LGLALRVRGEADEAEAQAVTAHGAALEFAARRTALRGAFATGCAVLACILVAAQAPAGVRAPVLIVFLCVVPGTALVGLVNPDSFAVELSLAIALSVAVSGLTAGVLVYAHLWSPTAVVVIVAAISIAAGLRDVGLGHRARYAAPQLLRLLRAPFVGARRVGESGLPVAIILTTELAGRAAGRLSGGIAAAPRLARRQAGRRRRGIAAVRPPSATGHRSLSERAVAPPVVPSPPQGLRLDEPQRPTGSHDRRRGQPPRPLADLQPQELAALLSQASLQRFLTQRAVHEIDPQLWFVDDLDRRLRRQAPASPDHSPLPASRGVWITGVSARTSIPVAWRVLEDEAKEWRTRLALEMIDALPELGLGGAVVAAGTAFGSLSGFRRGLEERCLPYLLRVDPVTAAREVARDRPSRSAAEARQELRERINEAGVALAGAQPNGTREEPELVLVEGAGHLLLCEVPGTGRAEAFWLSNLPPETAPRRLASLIRLANRSQVKRAHLLRGALEAQAEGGAGLDRELALAALAGGLRTLDLSTVPARGVVET
jgi:hypothetical protein